MSIPNDQAHDPLIRCPYCLHEFEWKDALWSLKAPPERAKAFCEAQNIPRETRVRYVATTEELKQEGYDLETSMSRVELLQRGASRLCPNRRMTAEMGSESEGIRRYFAVVDGYYTDFRRERVHHELPLNYGEAPRVTIPVIGGPKSGKTHLVASLGYALGTTSLGALGLTFSRWRDDAMRAYEQQDIDRLSLRHEVLPGTPKDRGRLINFTVRVDEPPSGMQPLVKRVFGKEFDSAPREFHVTLLDLAGEAVEDGKAYDYPGALDCDAAMFVVGPERVQGLARNYLGSDPESAHPLVNPILDLVEYVKKAVAPVPLALVLTKADLFDTVLAQLDEQGRLHSALQDAMRPRIGPGAGDAALGWIADWRNQPPDARRPFDERVTDVSRSVFSLLHVFGFQHDAEALIRRSSRHSFHAISATGFAGDISSLDDRGEPKRFLGFAPRSILTPLLTLLHQSRIVEFR